MIPAILGGTFAVTGATAGWVASSTSASVTAPLATASVAPVGFGGSGVGVTGPFGLSGVAAVTPFGPGPTLSVII